MQISRCPRRDSLRRFSIESLEERQLLTVFDIAWNPTLNAFRVPQNGATDAVVLSYDAASVISVNQPEHGAVELNSTLIGGDLFPSWPTATYTPDADFIGVDSFEVTLQARDGIQFTETIWLNVTETVYAIADWARVAPNTGANQISVLDNDYALQTAYQFPFVDLTDNELRIVSVSAENGAASISADGTTLVYSTNGDQSGDDTLTYTVADSFGNQSTAAVYVDVTTEAAADHFASEREFRYAAISSAVEQFRYQFASPTMQQPTLRHLCRVDFPVVFDLDGAFFNLAGDVLDATNVQVAGVDEGDLVETDGDYLYVASENQLITLDVRDPATLLVINRLTFDEPIIDMYLHEDRMTIVTSKNEHCFANISNQVSHEFKLHILDVEHAEAPQRVSTTKVDGFYENSRVIEGVLYMISTSWIYDAVPQPISAGAAGEPVYFNESVSQMVDRLSQSLTTGPVITSQSGDNPQTTPLITWQQAIRPQVKDLDFFTSITSFDLAAADGAAVDIDTLTGRASQVYVSNKSIYLFSDKYASDWSRWSANTDVQKFDIKTAGLGVDFAASGQFNGTLLNQFAADEYQGYLRVAANVANNQSDVYVLQQNGNELEVVAGLVDIAPGETIYSSRFDGARAFITTFRQIDPLFVIDFSDPTSPQIDGELKIPGFSNYLQVIDADHVIGLGWSDGRIWDPDAEMELSLFNVSDPHNPTRVATHRFGTDVISSPFSWSTLPKDHLALTYVQEQGVLALPIVHGETLTDESSSAIRVFQIDVQAESISVLGQVEFPDVATRSVHIAGHLFSISPSKIQVTQLLQPQTTIATVDLGNVDMNTTVESLTFDGRRATDLNGDGQTTGIDVSMINNALIRQGFGEVPTTVQAQAHLDKMDIDDDGYFAGRDVLIVLNKVIRNAADEAAGSSPTSAAPLFAGLGPDLASEFTSRGERGPLVAVLAPHSARPIESPGPLELDPLPSTPSLAPPLEAPPTAGIEPMVDSIARTRSLDGQRETAVDVAFGDESFTRGVR